MKKPAVLLKQAILAIAVFTSTQAFSQEMVKNYKWDGDVFGKYMKVNGENTAEFTKDGDELSVGCEAHFTNLEKNLVLLVTIQLYIQKEGELNPHIITDTFTAEPNRNISIVEVLQANRTVENNVNKYHTFCMMQVKPWAIVPGLKIDRRAGSLGDFNRGAVEEPEAGDALNPPM